MNYAPFIKRPLAMPLYPADGLAVEVLRQLHELDGEVDAACVVQDIRDIAESVGERLESSAALGDILFALNDQLFNVLGFHGAPEAQAEPSHNLLHRVLQLRYGDPLSLCIIYISVGRWLGLPLGGCDFPGRFLVRYHDEHGGVIIDPAAGGVQLQEADLISLLSHRFGGSVDDVMARGLLSDVDDKHLVVRLLRRLKQAYLKHEEASQALRVQEQIMQLAPDMPGGFRERGQLYELLDCPRAAAEDYSRYIDLAPDAGDAVPLRQRLSELLLQPLVLH
jgi:regulator of sirC expression with transglutaminase-like and TPR domain